MRLKKEVLKSRSRGPLSRVMYLNLSNLDIDIIERLNRCEYLHWFIGRNNNFQSDEGIERLKQLWHLDLSNNKIDHLISLNSFLALGTLILSNNNLKWQDLARLRHAHIMSLSLHGNPLLDSDPYYRIHVIDSLPLIWELDGRLVTVTERLHVKQFFVDTQYTEHPVRHKVSKPFQTSALKNIGTEGIVSDECKYIFSKFPVSETHTKHTDERRLSYLTHMVQEDMNKFLFENDIKTRLEGDFMEKFMSERSKDVERCNMVLLLLVISLEFQLPTTLVRSALVASQLDMIGSVSIMPYFLLPREFRTRVIGLLLNAAKVDRDNKVSNEGGLYAQLFMCIYYTVAQLTKISQTSHNNMQKIKPIPHNSDYMALMASEVVSLMMRGTQFLHLIPTEHGVVSLLASATGDLNVVYRAKEKMLDFKQGLVEKDDFDMDEEIRNIVLQAIEIRLSKVNIKMADIPIGDRYLALSDSLPIKPLHSVIWTSNFLSNGQTIPRTEPTVLKPERKSARQKPLQPKLGEKVLLGPQVVGELSMLMGGEIAMVKIDAVPVANGAVVSKLKSNDAHFAFVDMQNMCYAYDIHMWRPLKTEGDKYTIHSTDPGLPHGFKQSVSTHKVDPESTPLIYSSRERRALKSAQEGSGRKGSLTLDKSKGSSMKDAKQRLNANNHNDSNFTFSNNEFEELFPEDKPNLKRPSSVPAISVRAHSADANSRKGTCSAVNCGLLHENDDVHYIRGLTPREDSSRSCSITATPSDRKQLSEISLSPSGALEKIVKLTYEDDEQNGDQAVGKATSRLDGSEENRQSENVIDSEPESQKQGAGAPNVQLLGEDSEPSSSRLSPTGTGIHSHADSNATFLTEAELDDNCPICIAKRQGTILKAVNGQLEAIDVESPSETVLQRPTQDKQNENSKNESSVDQDNIERENVENCEPTAKQVNKVRIRPKSSLPTGGVRLRSGDAQTCQQQQHVVGRPKSAMESYSYYVITNPPNVLAKGTKAKMNDRPDLSGQSVFKTDFQQQREEAWKRTTRSRRPQTAAVMTASHLPPPQRPSSPIVRGEKTAKNSRFKVTHTDRWLGGGRDLFWESVRKRPKSGHVPGWKEGLPESMRKKQRPFTAHSMPVARSNMISRPGSRTFVSSCSNCNPSPCGYVTSGQYAYVRGDEDGTMFMMPQSQAIHHPMDLRARVVTSPVSDEEEQIFLDDNLAKEKGLVIQGIPPFTVPHPRKFTYLPSDMDVYSTNDFLDYGYMEGGIPFYHSSTRGNFQSNSHTHQSWEYCPPPSPLEERNLWETEEISDELLQHHPDSFKRSTPYKLCPFHENIFKKGDGNVVIYVIESSALEN